MPGRKDFGHVEQVWPVLLLSENHCRIRDPQGSKRYCRQDVVYVLLQKGRMYRWPRLGD